MGAHVAYHCMPCIECIECIVRYRALLCAIGGHDTSSGWVCGVVALLMSCSGICPEAFAEELP